LPEALRSLTPRGVVEHREARTEYGIAAGHDLPCTADARLQCSPVPINSRRRTHTISVSDEKIVGSWNIVCEASVCFGDRRCQIPRKTEVERERVRDSPVVLTKGAEDLPAATGDGAIEGLVVNG
jgi:hypothetical protein